MREHLKRNLLLGLAAAAVIGAVIVAVAPGSGHHHRTPAGVLRPHGDEQLAAEYLGIGYTALRQRLRAGESMAEVANATRGRSAAGLMADLLAHRKAALATAGESPGAEREAVSRARVQVTAETNRTRGRTRTMQVAATYLGISETALRAGLRAGRSLAELAAEHDRSRAGLVEALAALRAKRLRTALAQREITAAEEKTALSTLHARVLRAVEQQRTASGG